MPGQFGEGTQTDRFRLSITIIS
jgi:hypothetical protein